MHSAERPIFRNPEYRPSRPTAVIAVVLPVQAEEHVDPGASTRPWRARGTGRRSGAATSVDPPMRSTAPEL